MAINRQDVLTIAKLARLTLTEDEINMFQEQLSDVLDYAAQLQQVDTTDVPPTASALPLNNVLRGDAVALSLDNEDALANAPDPAGRSFRVKAVLD